MGYELHITRAEHWTNSEVTPIAFDEWITYLSRDDEMRHDQFAEATTAAGEKVRVESPGLAVWTTCASTAKDDSAGSIGEAVR